MNGGVPYLMKQSVPVMQGAKGTGQVIGFSSPLATRAIINHQQPRFKGRIFNDLLFDRSPGHVVESPCFISHGSKKNVYHQRHVYHATFVPRGFKFAPCEAFGEARRHDHDWCV